MVMPIDIDHIIFGNPDYDTASNKSLRLSTSILLGVVIYSILPISDSPLLKHTHTQQVHVNVPYIVCTVGQLLNNYILKQI